MTEPKFLTKASFAEIIENKVLASGITHFEAVLEFCDEADKDPKEVLKYMQPVLLEKIRKSAVESGLIIL